MSLFSSIKAANKSCTYLLTRSAVQHQKPLLFTRGAKQIVINHTENDPEYEYPEKTNVPEEAELNPETWAPDRDTHVTPGSAFLQLSAMFAVIGTLMLGISLYDPHAHRSVTEREVLPGVRVKHRT